MNATPKPLAPPGRPQSLTRDPLLLVWAAYLILFPIYVFPSGLPQPQGLLILALAVMVFPRWHGALAWPAKRAVYALFLFTVYVTLSALMWSILSGTLTINLKQGFLLSPFFYIYNGLVFLLAIVVHQRRGERFIEITVRATVISVLCQIPLSFLFSRTDSLRSSGLFNNPNQFGYYALLSASIIMYGQRRAKLSTLHATIALVACTYLALLSASKAALVGTALVIAISLITRMRTVVLATIVATILMFALEPVGDTVDRSVHRITTDQSHTFFEERGYDRILEHPEYLVFGAGEGNYMRFAGSPIGAHELHSSAGTIVFCYGIFGSLLFLAFAIQLVRLAQVRQLLMLVPAAAYGLSHQGLRVTLLWIFLVLIVVMSARARAGPSRA